MLELQCKVKHINAWKWISCDSCLRDQEYFGRLRNSLNGDELYEMAKNLALDRANKVYLEFWRINFIVLLILKALRNPYCGKELNGDEKEVLESIRNLKWKSTDPQAALVRLINVLSV